MKSHGPYRSTPKIFADATPNIGASTGTDGGIFNFPPESFMNDSGLPFVLTHVGVSVVDGSGDLRDVRLQVRDTEYGHQIMATNAVGTLGARLSTFIDHSGVNAASVGSVFRLPSGTGDGTGDGFKVAPGEGFAVAVQNTDFNSNTTLQVEVALIGYLLLTERKEEV